MKLLLLNLSYFELFCPAIVLFSSIIQQIPELNASKQLLLKFPVVFKETNISEISYISLITSCLTAPKNLMD